MTIIGITGPTGAGKTTALNEVEKLGGAVIDCDAVYHQLLESDLALQNKLEAEFGPLRGTDGVIDRKKLGAIVFGEESKRLLLNRLTHPLVEQETRRRLAASQAALVALETALPREANLSQLCDTVWYIHAPEAVRIQRLRKSRGYSLEKCREMMASQLPEKDFRALCDQVIENGESLEATRRQIAAILDCGNR